jgi:hypothetical protein
MGIIAASMFEKKIITTASQHSAHFDQSWDDIADGAERPSRDHSIEAIVCER